MAEVMGGSEEVAVLVTKTDVIVAVAKAEAADISDESRIIDTEEDGVDKMAGGVIGFKNVDLVVIYIWGMARETGGGPQGLCEDRGFGTHRASSENDGLFGIGEEGEPGRYDQFSV